MKFGRIPALAVATTLVANVSAWGGPIKPPKPQLAPQNQKVAPVYYHRHHHWRHYAASYISDENGGYDPAFSAFFWPLAGGECLLGGCGMNAAYDPGCAFYGCGDGWGLGPFAWGLYGLGFYDPLGLYGSGYAGYSDGGYGGGFGQGAGGRHFGEVRFGGRHFGGFRHYGGFHHHGGFRHYAGFHHYGGLHHFGGRGFMAFHGGGFHGGGFHGGGGHGRR